MCQLFRNAAFAIASTYATASHISFNPDTHQIRIRQLHVTARVQKYLAGMSKHNRVTFVLLSCKTFSIHIAQATKVFCMQQQCMQYTQTLPRKKTGNL
jgi:hypothetical protein